MAMQVSRITISNFKNVREIEIALNDLTFLVGGNNSGKSSVLQAIHMAVSCAQASSEFQQQVVAESNLRYSPTADFQTLGHLNHYENRKDGSRGVIEFFGTTNDDADASYRVEIYKARNYHNVGIDRSGVYPGFGQYICDQQTLFSVYVPGLAGIPHREEMQSYASIFRRAAGGDANLVFRNIIRLINDRKKIDELERLLFDVIGCCRFKVEYDPNRDLYVRVYLSLQDGFPDYSYVPIDLCGTGVLQITQILAYVILFRPRLLLVDEPDSHLHPSRQALLNRAFERIVAVYNCRILVSTHSRHLVSSAPAGTKLVWLRSGKIETQDDNDLTALLLDLGALDQLDSRGADILICTEDKGKEDASSAAVIQAMAQLLHKRPIIIVHRDRDFLTDDEINHWSREFTNRGMAVFSPRLPDIESYFVQPSHVSQVYNISLDVCKTRIDQILIDNEERLRRKFRDKRREATRRYWEDGGGPATDSLWPEDAPPSENTILGKEIVPKINEIIGREFGRKDLFSQPSLDLVAELNSFLRGNTASSDSLSSLLD